MVDVGAKLPEQPCYRRGITTLWVKADSEAAAIESGRAILERRRYARTGKLTSFREENTHVEPDAPVDLRDGIAARYTALKEAALKTSDGLFELWFPAPAANG